MPRQTGGEIGFNTSHCSQSFSVFPKSQNEFGTVIKCLVFGNFLHFMNFRFPLDWIGLILLVFIFSYLPIIIDTITT